jgi:CubicO group peptidase (beta-lactamase class C family)
MAHVKFPHRALALCVLCTTVAMAQSAPPPDLDAYVGRVMRTFEVPGIAVAIIKDNKVVLSKGYGVRKLGDSTPVDENTLFAIGSNTKAFTVAALAALVDENKISWDDRVYQHLTGFRMYDLYASQELTIRDMLTHRSGLGEGEGDLLDLWPSRYTRQDIVSRVRFMKPTSSFRSRFAYNNVMYTVAGEVLAAVTGKSWEDNIRERILDPLGMRTTTLNNISWKPGDNYAWPHSKRNDKLQAIKFVNDDNGAAAGGISSSVAEMSKWVLLQLNHGKYPDHDGRLFSEARQEEMWSAQTIIPITGFPPELEALQPKFFEYGMGWLLHDYHGRKLVDHTGGVDGFVSAVQLVPEENLGIVVLTNAERAEAFYAVVYYVMDHYLGVHNKDWIAALRSANQNGNQQQAAARKLQQNARAATSSPSLPLAKYAGTYSDPWLGTSTIRMENGKLVLTFDHSSAAVADLEHWQYNTFQTHWREPGVEEAFVTFALKADGSVDHFTMLAVSPAADFSFDYQDLYFTPLAKAGKQ